MLTGEAAIFLFDLIWCQLHDLHHYITAITTPIRWSANLQMALLNLMVNGCNCEYQVSYFVQLEKTHH